MADSKAEQPTTRAYRIYVLVLFTAVYLMYQVDRNAVLITQEMFKQEFGLSDKQVGLISGTILGTSFAMAGLPMGYVADRLNRTRVLSAVLILWSGLTALCTFASSFWHLAIARLGVGVAEAGGNPSAVSILADLFPPERRGTAMGVYFSGAALGTLLSMAIGGYIAAEFGWRAVFLLFGIPGVILGILILTTTREPSRTGKGPADGNMLANLASLLRNRRLMVLYIGASCYTATATAMLSWTVPFLLRVHHVDVAKGGVIVGITAGVAGAFGTAAAGILSDLSRRLGGGGPALTVAALAGLNMVLGIGALLAGNLYVVIGLLFGWGFVVAPYSAPIMSRATELVAGEHRGLAVALFMVMVNLIGVGIGPLGVGIISDMLAAKLGSAEALRAGMICLLLLNVVTILVLGYAALLDSRAERGATETGSDGGSELKDGVAPCRDPLRQAG
jgi:predicted MFS family arabinose efflux permease